MKHELTEKGISLIQPQTIILTKIQTTYNVNAFMYN